MSSDDWILNRTQKKGKTSGDHYAEAKRATTNYRLGLVAADYGPLLLTGLLTALFPEVALPVLAAILAIEGARVLVQRETGRDIPTPGYAILLYFKWATWARRWSRSAVKAGAANAPVGTSFEEYVPGGARVVFMSVRDTPAGVRFKVRHSIRQLLEREDDVAEKLNWPIRITRNPRPNEATVIVRLRDPFADPEPLQWPWLNAERIDAYDPVPIAIDEEGHLITLNLADGSLLVGGLRRKGKSVLLQLLCAVGALAENAQLWVIDGKGNELLPAWAPVAAGWAKTPDQAVDMLTRLRGDMLNRLDQLARLDPPRRKVERDLDMPLHILVVDELAYYTDDEDKDIAGSITRLLREIVSLGGAAGIPPIVATQKPSVDMIPSKLRDQFAYAAAFPSKTPQASDTILGQGAASRGYDASTMKQPGVALFDMEEGEPIRGRVFFLTDENIAAITARAQMSGIADLEAMLAEVDPGGPALSNRVDIGTEPEEGSGAQEAGAAGHRGAAPGDARLSPLHERVLELVASRPGELSKSAIERLIPLSGQPVKDLVAWGLLVRRGEKRYTRYWPAGS